MTRALDAAPILDTRIAQAELMLKALRAAAPQVHAVINAVRGTIDSDGTLFTCGNGGSAAEALHLSEELTGRYRSNRKPLRSVCLCADPTALTCIANDFGFDQVFARPLRALGRKGDALVVFSTSGRSPNLVAALDAARALRMRTVGLLGGTGGACKPLCDVSVVLDGVDGAAIQEAHQLVMHAICEALEDASAAPA